MAIRNPLAASELDTVKVARIHDDVLALIASEVTTRDGRRRWSHRSAAMFMLGTLGVAGVGTAAAATLGAFQSGYVLHPAPGKAVEFSPNLQLKITPDHGPLGSKVDVRVTGCFDPSGNQTGISYNAAAFVPVGTSQSIQFRMDALSIVHATRFGPDLSGTFVVDYAPAPQGQFLVSCGQSNRTVTFTVTGPRTNTASRRSVTAVIASESKTPHGYRLVLAPARIVEESPVRIPGASTFAVDVPSDLVSDPYAIFTGNTVRVTIQNGSVVALVIL